MSKIVLSFVFTMLCQGLHIDIKNMCQRSDKFCVKVKLDPTQSYELNRNVTFNHTKVTFNGSRLYAIPGNFFFVFPFVEFLTMSRCNLKSLTEADFMEAENLKRLELWKNHLQILPGNLFTGVRDLEWLDLSSNQIRTLHPNCFHGLRKLKKLLLFRNRIRILPSTVFRDLVALDTLHLEENLIEALEEDVFATNSRLGIVRIRKNRLKVVHPSIFISMRNLHWLDLSYNYFDEIQTSTLDTLYINDGEVKKCLINGKVRNLYADNNQIQSLYIQDLTNIQEIHLANNRLHDVHSIVAAKHLLKLDISKNPLQVVNSLDFAQMPELVFLNLSHTNLHMIGSNTFTMQENLTVLDLSHNRISSLSAEILSPLMNLRELYVGYNWLQEIPYTNMSDVLPAMVELGLNGNKWRCSYLREVVEYMERNDVSLLGDNYNDNFSGSQNVAGITCAHD